MFDAATSAQGMPLVPLADVTEPVSTINPAAKAPFRHFNYIDLRAVDQDAKKIIASQSLLGEEAPSRARQLIQNGDVLVSKVRPNLNGVALVPEKHAESVASTGFCVLRPRNNVLDAPYLFHWVRSRRFIDTMASLATGASYPAVSDSIVRRSVIPLPPLPEQRRIAAILDQANALRAKRQAVLAQLDEMAHAIFVEMFGDPLSNPKDFPLVPFGRICKTKLGKMLDQKKQTGNHRKKYLRNINIQWFHINVSDLLEMDFTPAEVQAYSLRLGDLLICEGGEPGRAAVWSGQTKDCYFQKALHRARPDVNLALPDYLVRLLWYLVNGGGLRHYVTVSTISHLTKEKLDHLPVPLPSLGLQRAFAERVSKFEALKSLAQLACLEHDALFASLQHRAFTGAL